MKELGKIKVIKRQVSPRATHEYKIKLCSIEGNGLHVLAARWNMSFKDVITIAVDELLRKKLSTRDYKDLDDRENTNYLIGSAVNANRGVVGYINYEQNIPQDKKWLLV